MMLRYPFLGISKSYSIGSLKVLSKLGCPTMEIRNLFLNRRTVWFFARNNGDLIFTNKWFALTTIESPEGLNSVFLFSFFIVKGFV